MRAKLLGFFLILWMNPVWALQALVSTTTLKKDGSSNWAEIHLLVRTESLRWKMNASGKAESGVTVFVQLKKDGKIVQKDGFKLKSPAIDTAQLGISSAWILSPELLHFERYSIGLGQFEGEITIADLNDTTNRNQSKFAFESTFPTDEVLFSQPFFFRSAQNPNPSLERSGKFIIPYPNDIFGQESDTLQAYTELYQTFPLLPDSSILFVYYLKKANSEEILAEYGNRNKVTTSKILPFFIKIPLNSLPIGNYQLVVEARNMKYDLLDQKALGFRRTLPKKVQKQAISDGKLPYFVDTMTTAQVREHIRSILPVMGAGERNLALPMVNPKYADTFRLKPFFAQFWVEKNPGSPEEGWVEYRGRLAEVNRLFACPRQRGYETERGRVYLQYGPPDQRTERKTDPVALPYEVWWYYNLVDRMSPGRARQRDARFLFYNKEVAACEYRLLHSTAFGETNNPQWKLEIFRRTTPMGNTIDSDRPANADSESIRILESTFNNN
jgi:GWxTD domain-containing protein